MGCKPFLNTAILRLLLFINKLLAERYFDFSKDSIGRTCRGERLTVKGYHFDFVETTKDIQERKRKMQLNDNKNSHSQKKVLCVELNKIFQSASEASKYFGYGNGYVSGLIVKNKKSVSLDYTFKYIEES